MCIKTKEFKFNKSDESELEANPPPSSPSLATWLLLQEKRPDLVAYRHKIVLFHMDIHSWRDNPRPGPPIWSCWIKCQVLLTVSKERKLVMTKHFYATPYLPSDKQWSSQWTKFGISESSLNQIILGIYQIKILAEVQPLGRHSSELWENEPTKRKWCSSIISVYHKHEQNKCKCFTKLLRWFLQLLQFFSAPNSYIAVQELTTAVYPIHHCNIILTAILYSSPLKIFQ